MNSRITIGFILSVLAATTVTALAVGFPFTLFPPITLAAILGGAVYGGPTAAVLLGIGFVTAIGLSRSRMALILAGGLAGLAFIILGLALDRLGLPSWHSAFHPVAQVMGGHPALERTLTLGLSAMVAGLLSGWVFGKIGYPQIPFDSGTDRDTYALLGLLLGSAPLLFGAWYLLHDPGGDRLCAHTDTVRVMVGKSVYEIPARYQPDLVPLDGGPADPVRVFDANKWLDSTAARQTHEKFTYCQTAGDKPWPVRSFMIGFLWGAAPKLPGMIMLTVISGLDFSRAKSPQIQISGTGQALWFLPKDGLVRFQHFGVSDYGTIYVPLPAGAWLEVRGDFAATPEGIASLLREAGPLLASLKRP